MEPPCMNIAVIIETNLNCGSAIYCDLKPRSIRASIPTFGDSRYIIHQLANIEKLMKTNDWETMNWFRKQ